MKFQRSLSLWRGWTTSYKVAGNRQQTRSVQTTLLTDTQPVDKPNHWRVHSERKVRKQAASTKQRRTGQTTLSRTCGTLLNQLLTPALAAQCMAGTSPVVGQCMYVCVCVRV